MKRLAIAIPFVVGGLTGAALVAAVSNHPPPTSFLTPRTTTSRSMAPVIKDEVLHLAIATLKPSAGIRSVKIVGVRSLGRNRYALSLIGLTASGIRKPGTAILKIGVKPKDCDAKGPCVQDMLKNPLGITILSAELPAIASAGDAFAAVSGPPIIAQPSRYTFKDTIR